MKTFAAVISMVLVSGLMLNASAADKLQHVVCFKFKPTATAQDIGKVEEAFSSIVAENTPGRDLRMGYEC